MIWLLLIPANWLLAWIISWLYVGWLWGISKDVKFEGWIRLWGWLPIARFRLISTKSWYAKIWLNFYGFAMMLIMIHRDEKGQWDDRFVEQTIVHEARHCVQMMWLGTIFWLVYGADMLRMKIMGKHPYRDCVFERDARAAETRWENSGRPPKFTFGARR